MVQINEQVAALGRTQLDATIRGAEVAVDAWSKLGGLQFEIAKATYADSVGTLRRLASVKDPSQFASMVASPAQPAWDKTSAYAKSAYEIVSAAQSEFAALLEEHVAEFNKSIVVTLDAAAKSAPPGSESVVSAIKSAVQSSNTWYETAVKAARQLTAATEASLAGATAQVAPVRRKAA